MVDPQGKPAERFAVLWVERGRPGDVDQLFVEATGDSDSALQHRAIVNARLGRKKEALDDMALLQKGAAMESTKLYAAVVVAADLGEGQDEAIGRLEAALKARPGDGQLAYDAACAYSLASRALDRPGRPGDRSQAERAIQLLRAAIDNGYSYFDHIQEDTDLDPIRGLPAFGELIAAGQSDRRHDAVWIADARFERAALYGLDAEAHLRRCRELTDDGYRPVSLSGSRTTSDGPAVMASVWHRPVVSESAKDELAERQARAAVALVRLGHSGDVWPLLRDSADPRLRSFIVNWLHPLGAEAKTIVAEFDRLDSAGGAATTSVGRGSHDPAREADKVGRGSPDPAREADRRSPSSRVGTDSGRPSVPGGSGSGDPRPTLAAPAANVMDVILFAPETSTRRALDPGPGHLRDRSSFSRRARAHGRPAPRTLRARPGRRHPWRIGLDLAAVERAPETRDHSCPFERQEAWRPPLVCQ